MAIYAITGAIGGGKTYYAVKKIKDLLKERPSLLVCTNIRGLKLPHMDLDSQIEKAGSLEAFFHPDYQKEFLKGSNIVYVIDEAQQYFHRRFYNKDVFLFFQTSRHFGCDIFLITQDKKSLCTELRDTLIEQEIHCLRRSQSLTGEFRYNLLIAGQVASKETLRPSKKIFDLYQSYFENEKIKVKKPLYKYLFLGLVVFVSVPVFIFGFYQFGNTNSVKSGKNISLPTLERKSGISTNSTSSMDLSKFNVAYVFDGYHHFYMCSDGKIYTEKDIARGVVKMVSRKVILCPKRIVEKEGYF